MILKLEPGLKKSLMRLKHNRFVLSDSKVMYSMDETFRRMHYVRYADDFIFGFIGLKSEAKQIQKSISDKIETMKMSINQEKSFILHSHSRGIKYLGAFLRYHKKNAIRKRNDGVDSDSVTKQVSHLQERAINSVQYRALIESMLERLVNKGLLKKDQMVP